MEKFVVSARKYRPLTFDSVVGQSHITTTLKNAIREDKLAQAFLFCGPRGVGKTTNARILAKTINCTNKTEQVEACGQCDSCKAFNQNASFNIHELDAASNNTVDDIRNLVDQVRFPPQAGKYKVYIIDEVHMLSNQAFNAFLKTLEEPPSYAIFILATTEKHKIIPTILSRCQIFDFNRIKVKDIAEHLHTIAEKEEIGIKENSLHLIGQKADGGLRDALSMFDLLVAYSGKTINYEDVIENLHILDYDYYFEFTQAFDSQDMSKALILFDQILEKGFDVHNFISGLSEHFRDLLVCQDPSTIQLLDLSEDIKQKYLMQAGSTSKSFLLSALSIMSQCELNFKQAKNQRLHAELCLIKLANLKSVFLVSKQETIVSAEKKKVNEPTISIKNEESKPVAERGKSTPSFKEKHHTAKDAIMASSTKKLEKTIKIPKISDLRLGKNNSSQAKLHIKEETKNYNQAPKNDAFTENDLRSEWQNFRESLKNFSWQGVMKQDFTLEEGNLVSLRLTNKLELDLLEHFRSDLLQHLKINLNNASIKLEARIIKTTEKNARPYTPMEKFQYMQNKNPNLRALTELLSLDVNF